MNTPIPRLDETPVERKQRLDTETEVRNHQRLHALSLLQPAHARTRRQVARLLGGSRTPVGRWLAASAAGGVARRRTMAKAPGKTPLVPPAVRQALTQRLAQPEGLARDQASWHGRQHDDGLALAETTVHRRVREQWRANLQGPRQSPIKHPCRGVGVSGALSMAAPGETHRGTACTTRLCSAPCAHLWSG